MAERPSDYEPLLASGRWFSGLPEGLRRGLLGAAVVKGLRDGARLFSRGDAPDGLYAVLEGALRVTAVGSEGREAVLAVVEPPQWLGEIAVFDRLPRTHDAVAAGATRVLHVPAAALDALLAQTPAWWRDLGLLATNKLRLLFLALEDAALQPLLPRLARRLVMMAEGHGELSGLSRRVLKVRQEVLAAMVGSSRQSVNQALKELEAQGLVRLAYGELELLDPAGLQRLAQGAAPTPAR